MRGRLAAIRRTALLVVSGPVLFLAAVAPGLISSGSALSLLRVPLESVVVLVVLATLPWPIVRRIVAVLVSIVFIATILSAALDFGFILNVGAPFNIVTGWPEVTAAYGVLQDSTGAAAAVLIVVALFLAALVAGVLIAASFLTLAGVIRRHYRAGLIGASAITAGWLVLALIGIQIVAGEPVASADAVGTVITKANQVRAAAAEQAAFDKAGTTDPYAHLPASDLLTGLKGKDVIVAFIESYGQVAVQNTFFPKASTVC